jgi:hypothetical protein
MPGFGNLEGAMVDPYINPDAKWRKTAKSRRRKRGWPVHLIVAGVALLILGGGFAYWITRPPDAAAALADVVPAFQADWNTMEAADLYAKWSRENQDRTRAKFARLLASKGWEERRPELELLTIEGSDSGRAGRTDFHPKGLPPDALVKVYWITRYGHFKVVRFSLDNVPALPE